ncbi:hypothetical protein LWI29_030053 [Acer saccharum]|uniref:RNA-dependent RNA polymerase n=1 Tax=Acer saccharum TaxID=4024 RepID=A0AA39REG3_ACESA|nr:hypothetical protein LWI29_030053 [Acer saccharum]
METQPSIAMTESPTQQQVSLPHSVEHLMSKICVEQSQPPPDPSARRMLASLGEESALEILRSIAKSKIRHTFSGFITHMVKNLNNNGSPLKRVCLSPSQQNRSPVTTVRLMNSHQGTDEAVNSSQQRGSSSSSSNPRAATTMRTSIPQYVALGELDFRKAFLILSYIGEKSLEEVTTADEIRRLKDLHMHRFEAEVWKTFGVNYIKPEDRRRLLDWDSGKTHIYHCHVFPDGSYTFKDSNGNIVYRDGKPLIHTDGTGFISEDLALKCPKNVLKGKCSNDDNIEVFPMFKVTLLIYFSFPSNQPRKTFLSKNLIALLRYGGVPENFFEDLLRNALEDSQGVFTKKRNSLKVSLNYGGMDDFIATRMILSGIPLDESYLQYRLSILMNEEKKSLLGGKLPVPESYYLMGTVDPTGTLKSDEVCIVLNDGQVSWEKVLVYRNPGLHFGDIHVLKATYVKELEDIIGNSKYAIFFPTKGPRSLADEIAGGDFDGDTYFVSRNPELLKHFKESERWKPTSATSNVSNKRPSDFLPEELEDELFKRFLTTRFQPCYAAGVAANSWLAIMDRLLTLGDESANEKTHMKENLLQLIDIYYDSLDAPKKSGRKIEIPEELMAEMFPIYMGRDESISFDSKSILGKIYHTVKSYEAEDLTMKVWKLPCFDVGVPEPCKTKWKELYGQYRQDMRAALCSDKEDKNEAADEVIKNYKQILYGAEEFEQSTRSLEEIYNEALAIYHITYDFAENKEAVGYCNFAWKVAGSALCKLYALKQSERTMVCLPSVLKEICG